MPLANAVPNTEGAVFIAPTANVIGAVNLHAGASVWYGAVLRADSGDITIGPSSNVQDRSVISGTVSVGSNVTIGHGALISDGVSIADNCLIGQGSVLSDNVEVGENSMVAAGAVVLPGTAIPSGQMWSGNPAAFSRDCTAAEIKGFVASAEGYVNTAKEHVGAF
jgi:carbonic anhydrase/acetyltransferase-like protein (isoleucine patch superfamily)